MKNVIALLTIVSVLTLVACGGGDSGNSYSTTNTSSSSSASSSSTSSISSSSSSSSGVSSSTSTSSSSSSVDTTRPSAPTGLTAIAASATQINLNWSASTDTGGSGLSGYHIYRNGTQIAGTVSTSYNDNGLTSNTQYTYIVRAYDNAANESVDSTNAVVSTPVASTSGLDARPSNTSCVAAARPSGSASVALQRVFSTQSFSFPIAALQAPGDNNHWYILEKSGRIKVFNVNSPSTPATVFLDLTDRVNSTANEEAGLLGLAFDPNFVTTHRAYVFYTASADVTGYTLRSTLSRFTSADNGATLNAASEEKLIVRNKSYGNHNGGQLAFGPDGYLYAGLGDGGSPGDAEGNAQNLGVLFGKIIRLDVAANLGYQIPSGNPYSLNATCGGQSGIAPTTSPNACPEIYAYGFRNPWRFSFDKAAAQSDLWVGDVGEGTWEEVDRLQHAGGNYGWPIKEGANCLAAFTCANVGADGAPFIDPLTTPPHSAGFIAIIGGYVYRGAAMPSLVGSYLFANYSPGNLEVYDPAAANGYRDLIASTGITTSAFAQDNAGELYAVEYDNSGGLYQLVPGSGAVTNPVPTHLTDTGCVDANDPTKPAAGLIPYTPNASFWSDGTTKDRWLAIPDGTQIAINNNGHFDFPIGAVLMKNFRLNNLLIETRLFMRHTDGVWAGYSYQWNNSQTQATLVQGGASVVYNNGSGNQTWIYPSGAQCLECHNSAPGFTLGLEIGQLNGSITYPQTNRSANQITTLNTLGMLTPPQVVSPSTLAYVSPADTTADLTQRARVYLHENCSQCHRPGGPTPVNLDLRYSTALSATGACNADPAAGNLAVTGAKIIAPGNAAKSVLYLRMSRRDINQMPPLATNLIDAQGAQLLQDWINSLDPATACN